MMQIRLSEAMLLGLLTYLLNLLTYLRADDADQAERGEHVGSQQHCPQPIAMDLRKERVQGPLEQPMLLGLLTYLLNLLTHLRKERVQGPLEQPMLAHARALDGARPD